MEQSVLPRLETENSKEEVAPEKRSPADPQALLALFEAQVPVSLHRFGRTVEASALGSPSRPPVVVLGGISANRFPALRADGGAGWWSNLAGKGRWIDPDDYYVLGVDFAADETGATAPSTSDQARILAAALDTIGVDRPVTIVGASYGAMVGLALAEAEPTHVARLVVVSGADEPHPASTAARELQRRVVALGQRSGCAAEALSIARGLAMLTYRTPAEFQDRFEGGIDEAEALCFSEPGAYLRARGQAFCSVMSPGRFLSLSASIDRHRVNASKVRAPCLLIGAKSDQLVLPEQLRHLADRLGGPAKLHLLNSLFGHDMFLKEADRIGALIQPFLARQG